MGNDPASDKRREAMFSKWDVNSNGGLSFTEVDRGMRDLMKDMTAELLKSKKHEWNKSWKPVIMRAYEKAKDYNKRFKKKSKRNDDYIERDEFRLLLVCMRQYFELYMCAA